MAMRSEKNHEPEDWVTMSFRVRHKHALLIHTASEAQPEHFSTATYMRKLVLTWTAEELGIPVPDYSASELNQEDITAAAASVGMSPREFMAVAAREMAASMLAGQKAAKAAKSPTPIGTGKRTASGQRAKGSRRSPNGARMALRRKRRLAPKV